MKKFIAMLLSAAALYCGEGHEIVSKETKGIYTTYTCDDGTTFDHNFGGFIK